MENVTERANELGKYLSDEYERYINEKSKNLENKIVRKINLSMSNACEDGVALLVSKVLGSDYKFIIDSYLTCEVKGKQYRPDIVVIKNYREKDKIINKFVAIIEVKAQMGYCWILEPSMFKNKIDKSKKYRINFSDKDYEQLSNNKKVKEFYLEMGVCKEHPYIDCVVSDNLNFFVVNVLSSNHSQNVGGTIYYFDDENPENYNKDSKNTSIHFYSLYGNGAWYDSADESKIYELDKEETINIKIKNNKKTYILNEKIRKRHGFAQFITDLKELTK